jgi:hypothetical protein
MGVSLMNQSQLKDLLDLLLDTPYTQALKILDNVIKEEYKEGYKQCMDDVHKRYLENPER